ncbi:MAG: DNA replication/repair protein RecF [Oscillospiraceae bacterium]
MYLIEHRLENYKNIKQMVFCPPQEVSVICGENGQGKTNLLESIFLLTGARSFRKGKDSDLIMKDEDFATINSSFFCAEREQEIKLDITEKGRGASLNKGTRTKASALAGVFCCVVFSPEHLELVKGAPDKRRRFLDTALCQISPRYLSELKKYSRLTDQKNSLLKDCRSVAAAHDMIDIFDTSLAESCTLLTDMRRSFVDALRGPAADTYFAVCGGREAIDISYYSTMFGAEKADASLCLEALKNARIADMRAGFCTVGVHRDDLLVSLDREDSRVFSSQGQQRSIVLSLKLAEAEVMERCISKKPVLLLDDVLSELDKSSQDYLIKCLRGRQSIITSCEPDFIEKKTGASVFKIANGALVERNKA